MNRLSRRSLVGLALSLPLPVWARARPAEWAQAVVPALDGLPNLHRVTHGFYRSAQPDAAGFAALPGLGVTEVLSLRQMVDDTPLARGTGLHLHRIAMKSRDVGEDNAAHIVAALRLIRRSKGPILLHCRHGADRTGVVCAVYRILFQHWTRAEALAELTQGGFNFHPVWQNIPRFVMGFDVADVKARVLA